MNERIKKLAEHAGKASQSIAYINQCVEKYGDMPANKVKQHCQEILEFKK